MSHLDPIAYTTDADVWCRDCIIEVYGVDPLHKPLAEDNEGNPIGAIAPWDGDWYENDVYEGRCGALVCNHCFAELDTYEHDWTYDGINTDAADALKAAARLAHTIITFGDSLNGVAVHQARTVQRELGYVEGVCMNVVERGECHVCM